MFINFSWISRNVSETFELANIQRQIVVLHGDMKKIRIQKEFGLIVRGLYSN